jgi:formate dehydrogenase maturation protein FdhE
MSLERAILELAEHFKTHGMHKHLQSLRGYYRQRTLRKRQQALSKEPGWDEDMVVQWLALFQIAPFDGVYTVLAKWNTCPCGGGSPASDYTSAVFPGGRLARCGACGKDWLRLDVV